jgi:hypothetical protein
MPYVLIVAASVAIANIFLNMLTSKAAAEAEAWLDVFATRSFGLAFVTGTAFPVADDDLISLGARQ